MSPPLPLIPPSVPPPPPLPLVSLTELLGSGGRIFWVLARSVFDVMIVLAAMVVRLDVALLRKNEVLGTGLPIMMDEDKARSLAWI